jgi:hypothetical protein
MSLKIMPIPPIPEETVRVAHAAFPHGTLLIQIRDGLEALSTDETFADLFPSHGQPAEAPWRLALVSVLQFVEGLTTDRPAGGRRRAESLGLEICAELGTDRSRLRPYGLERVPYPPASRRRRAALARCSTRPGTSPGLAQRTRPAADRLDPCSSRQPHAGAGRSGGRDATTYP